MCWKWRDSGRIYYSKVESGKEMDVFEYLVPSFLSSGDEVCSQV